MKEIIRVEGLVKDYGKIRAVDHVSFGIPEGSCFGLLGPNGAGKTTTIEIMEGIGTASEGKVLFREKEIDRHFRQKVGIQFQSTALPEFITVKETLDLFSAFYPNPRPLEETVALCSLEDILHKDNQKLSGGQRQRMLLGIAILGRPELVFLDEPTTGLDPQARRNFWDLIRRIKAENTTVVLTTHYMDEAQELCDYIAIMDHGKLLELDTPVNLLEKHFSGVLLKLPAGNSSSERMKALSASSGLSDIQFHNDQLEVQTTTLDKTLKDLLAAQVDLTGLSIHKPDLEDLFIKLTGSSLRA